MQRRAMTGTAVVLVLFLTSISWAGTHLVELSASRGAIEGGYEHNMPVEQGFLTAGIGALYSEDDYRMGNAKFTLGNGLSSAGLRFNLGFKGVIGSVEENSKKATLMAIGFLFSGAFTIPETMVPIPVVFSLNISMAPEPLCFLDSDRYMDFKVGLDFGVVKNAAVMLGYRRIETRLEQDHGNWEKSDDMLFIGYQLKF